MSHLTQLLLLLALLITGTKAAGALSVRLGQPAVFGEIMGGLLLGPTALDILSWPIFPDRDLHLVVKDVAEIGVILLMFLAGLETDLEGMRRVGVAALSGAVGGVVLPFVGGWLLALAFGYPQWESIFIGTVLTATSVSISAQTLLELGKLRTKEGAAILGAAVIDDVLGILVLSLVVALSPRSAAAGGGLAGIVVLLAKMAAFFAGAILLGGVLGRVVRASRALHEHQVLLTVVLIAILVYSWAAQALGGVAAITGSYLAGVFLGRTAYREVIEDKIKVFSYALFIPVFLASIGLEGNAREASGSVAFTLLLVGVAVVGKLGGVAAGALASRFAPSEALRFGIGMISRGEVALIISTIGLDSGVIDEAIFSALVLMTLATTLVTPPLLRYAFRHRFDPPENPAVAGDQR